MKNNVGLFPILLDKPKNANLLSYDGIANRLKVTLKMICATFIAFFALTGLSYAQTSDNNTTPAKGSRDISYKFREERKEDRAEKRSVRAVESISSITKDRFKVDFPNAENISWTAPQDFDEVDFTVGGSKMMAFYDFDNHMIGTGKYISFNDLPANGLAEIARKYKGYVAQKTMYYDDNEDNDNNLSLFGVPMDQDSYFIQMKNGDKKIVLQMSKEGNVTYFSTFK